MPMKNLTTKGWKPNLSPLSRVMMDERADLATGVNGRVCQSLIIKNHEEVQGLIYLW